MYFKSLLSFSKIKQGTVDFKLQLLPDLAPKHHFKTSQFNSQFPHNPDK